SARPAPHRPRVVFAVKVGLWGLLLIRPRTLCHQRTKCSLPFLFFSGARTEPTPLLWPSAFLKSTCGKETGGRQETLRRGDAETRARGEAGTSTTGEEISTNITSPRRPVAPSPALPASVSPRLRVPVSDIKVHLVRENITKLISLEDYVAGVVATEGSMEDQ